MPTTTTTTFKITKRKLIHLLCGKCQHGWYPRGESLPKICPQCKRILVEA